MELLLLNRPRRTRLWLAIGALAVIGGGGAALTWTGAAKHENAAPSPVASAALVPAQPSATLPRVAQNAPTVAGAGQTEESLSAQVDRLAKSGDPADAFAAFRVLLKCSQQSQCGDLSPGQRTMAYSLLQRAVAGHVPQAAVYLLTSAPDGRDVGEVWNDRAYADWRQTALREIGAAADRGDPLAMRQMAELAHLDNRPDTALAYATAYADRQPPQFRDAWAAVVRMYERGMTPEQVAAATAEGHKVGRQK